MPQRDGADRIRHLLLATLIVGTIGMSTELLLIGHLETLQQQIPVALLGAGVAAAAWHAAAPTRASVWALQALMVLFVVSGLAGVVLHYLGNAEFELEMYPAMSGFELVQNTMTGATPVLAPGSMTLLGFIGLTYAYKHPCLQRNRSRNEEGAR